MRRRAPTGLSRLAIAAGLVVASLLVYAPVLDHEFINWDDEVYVSRNPHVIDGMTFEGFRWVWTTSRASNWHPVTWLSHMLDGELYGLDAGKHHRTNLILHLLNTLLLFLFLDRATGARGCAGVVGLLFAVHPLHVESVAWVAERKDVLSTLFFMLVLLAYARYVARPSAWRYAAVPILLALGLMAKPMLVTLPFLLLLLDRWPFERLDRANAGRRVAEKLPLVALSAASCAVTLIVQRAGVASVEAYPPWERLANAVVAYAIYLRQTIWPSGLAAFYPHPRGTDPSALVVAVALLGALTVLAWRSRSRRPYLLVGWSWFVGTLVPVIGLVQVGEQAHADRYTYVPLIGLFVAVVWGARDQLGRRTVGRMARLSVLSAGFVLVLVWMVLARFQVGTWRDSETLFRHALEVTENNHLAHANLALALAEQGRLDPVIVHLEEALRIKPDDYRVHHNLAVAFERKGRPREAQRHLLRAIELAPEVADSHFNLGVSYVRLGDPAAGKARFEEALRVDPTHVPSLVALGTLLIRERRWDRAVDRLAEAARLDPGNGEARGNLAVALYNRGDHQRAWAELQLAIPLGFRPPDGLVPRLRERLP